MASHPYRTTGRTCTPTVARSHLRQPLPPALTGPTRTPSPRTDLLRVARRADGRAAIRCLLGGGRRLTIEMKCEGLDADQLARRSVPPSSLSLLGLVRHLAQMENHWF